MLKEIAFFSFILINKSRNKKEVDQEMKENMNAFPCENEFSFFLLVSAINNKKEEECLRPTLKEERKNSFSPYDFLFLFLWSSSTSIMKRKKPVLDHRKERTGNRMSFGSYRFLFFFLYGCAGQRRRPKGMPARKEKRE